MGQLFAPSISDPEDTEKTPEEEFENLRAIKARENARTGRDELKRRPGLFIPDGAI